LNAIDTAACRNASGSSHFPQQPWAGRKPGWDL
jgi:hypothetical protein